MKIGSLILAVFMTLFGLVFVVAGSGVIVMGIFGGDAGEEAPWFIFVPFGLVFVAAGSFVIWKGWRIPGDLKRAVREKERYADEPWKRVKEWRSSTIRDNSRGGVWFFWGFALFWNGITAAVIGVGWQDMLRDVQHEPAMYTILLFPLVGLGLLIAAIRGTIHAKKFPPSSITLSSMPIPLGGLLDGTLAIPESLRQAERIRVRLTCYRITRSGKNTHSTPVWQDEQERSPMDLSSDGVNALLPIRIGIPRDAQETTIDVGSRIAWQVDVSASVPGVDYSASFAVPVFGEATGDAVSQDGFFSDRSFSPRAEGQAGPAGPRTVRMEMNPDGGMMWDFRPGRVPGPAAGISAFAIVWGVISYILLTTAEAPILIGLVFAFFEILILWGAYDMWLTRITVTIRDGILTRRSGPVVTIRYLMVTRDEIGKLAIRSGMSAGTTAYHEIVLTRKNGKKLRIGPYLRSVREAETIVGEMKNSLGIAE